jgi:hypothetical protein
VVVDYRASFVDGFASKTVRAHLIAEGAEAFARARCASAVSEPCENPLGPHTLPTAIGPKTIEAATHPFFRGFLQNQLILFIQ